MKKEKISDAVIRRLPRYYRYLDELHVKGIVRISSGSLGKRMGVTASQIRQRPSSRVARGQARFNRMKQSESCTNMFPPSSSTPAL